MEVRSQTFTFALALITVLGGIVLIALGKAAQGLVPLVAAVAGLGGLFVYREVRSHRDPGREKSSDEQYRAGDRAAVDKTFR